jgi:GTP cyclohydrolase II/3,4-dihydroxy 2-butanone 4-phosphate synthase/GTP cyclohydrolase II
MSLIRYADAEIPTAHGPLRVFVYRDAAVGQNAQAEEHVAIVAGEVSGASNVLTRVHSECWTSEVLGSLKCDCREQLDAALARIAAEGVGVVVYLRQEGRGIGLGNKVRAYALQNDGADTVEANLALGFEADERRYDPAAEILKDLGVRSIRLLTNNPTKINGLRSSGVVITERISHWVGENQYNSDYLAVKRRKMGHHPGSQVKLRALPSARKG